MKLAFLFPGQGAQAVGMGRALAEAFPAALQLFETADRTLGIPLTRICWEGPEDLLKMTVHTQPALLVHSVAALRLLEAAGVRPSWCAGHSLGEYSACVAAGALGFEDALRLVHRRGELMHQAGIDRPGAMAVFLGLDREAVEGACAEAASAGIVKAANFNAPGQVTVSGEIAAVELASERAKARGAKRVVRLEVGGAFHSPLMASAAAGLNESLDRVGFRDPSCPVIGNFGALPLQRAEEIREGLKAQLLGAVRWEDSMRWLLDHGAEGFVEIGTGRVLRGLLRTIDRDRPVWNVEDPEGLQATLAALGTGSPAAGRA